ncbi:MAG: hypothetical protein M1812_003941 [Candelaria pacifica]|nr:MAG: hypothetical protein M1812_003941 [Candelaria pacifica]
MHFTRFSVLVKALVLVSLSSCTFAKAHPDNQIVPRDQESPRNEARDLVCVQDLILHDLEDAGIQGIDFCLTFIVIPQNTITIPTTSTPLFYTTTTINRTLVATQKIYATSTVTATEYDLLQVAKRAPSPTPTLPAYLKSLVPKGDSEKRPALRKKNASQDSALASSVSSACSCLGVTAGITLFTPVAEPTVSQTRDYMKGLDFRGTEILTCE